MRKRMTRLILLALLACGASAGPLEELVGPEWSKVMPAANSLRDGQERSLEKLIEMADDPREIRLVQTGDLIYPGAEHFYGHGFVVNYPLNWVAGRAGWLIEDITFQNFGFSGDLPRGDGLLLKSAQMQGQAEAEGPPDGATPGKLKEAAQRARDWFRQTRGRWTRFDGLKEAIFSDDPVRQQNALSYMRFQDSDCDGLTVARYQQDLASRVMEIARNGESSYEGPRCQACHLVSALPNDRVFTIRGVAPGMTKKQLAGRNINGLTISFEKGVVDQVSGDSLWENGTAILKIGDGRQALSALTPEDGQGLFDFAGSEAKNCGVQCELKDGRIVKLQLTLPRTFDEKTWPFKRGF